MIRLQQLIVIAAVFFIFSCNTSAKKEANQAQPEQKPVATTFVGAKKCASCHRSEYELWMNSDHELAMQEVNSKTVLADFNNSSFSYNGVTSNFFTRDAKYFVRTD